MKKITRLFFFVAILLAWGSVVTAQNTECSGTLTESGSEFNYKFETSGTDVIVTFEMVTPRTGLVAYAHTYNPNFAEVGMANAGGQKFTKTFTGQAIGATFKMACKFAWAAGGILETSTLSILLIPHFPIFIDFQRLSAPIPRDETAPIPVITTLLFIIKNLLIWYKYKYCTFFIF